MIASSQLLRLHGLRFLLLGGASVGLSTVLGIAVASNFRLTLELGGAVFLVGVTIRWPRHSLPFAIPATLLLAPITGGAFFLAVPLALTASWGLHVLTRKCQIYPLQHGLLLAFGGWLLLAYFVDDVHLETVLSPGRDLLTLLIGLAICAVAISLPPPKQLILSVSVASAAGLSLVALIAPTADAARVGALGLNPNYLGAALALGGVAAAGGWLHDKRNPVWVGALLACVVALRATESRGAFVMLAAGLGVLTLYGKRRSVQVVAASAIGALVLIPGVLNALASVAVGPRTATDFALSYQVRADALVTAVRYASNHPIFGVGYGQFAATAARDPNLALYINTHNDLLRLAAESGIPALGLFLSLAVLAWSPGQIWVPSTEKAILLTYLVGLLFANTLSSLAVTAPFWIWLGMALARSAHESAFARHGHKSSNVPSDPIRRGRESPPRLTAPEALGVAER